MQYGNTCLFCDQVVSSLRNKLLLSGAANLGAQGFLDTAQDLITKHQASAEANDIPSRALQLRLRILQVSWISVCAVPLSACFASALEQTALMAQLLCGTEGHAC